MKKYFTYLPITILMLISSKLFSTEVQSGAKDFEKKGKRGVELIDQLGKRGIEYALDTTKTELLPTKAEIKELKDLTPYLPKKGAIKNTDYTKIINELTKIKNTDLSDPKTKEEKDAFAKYSKPGLRPEDIKEEIKKP